MAKVVKSIEGEVPGGAVNSSGATNRLLHRHLDPTLTLLAEIHKIQRNIYRFLKCMQPAYYMMSVAGYAQVDAWMVVAVINAPSC